MRSTLICLTALAIAIFALPAAGQDVPELVNYQGLLTDAVGVPLATGTYDLLFSLYEDAGGTTLVWGPEIHADAQVIDGQFNVILGSLNALGGAFDGTERYLGVAVSPEPEITPRQRILSTPYALSAQTAHSAQYGVPAGSIISFAGSGTPAGGWLLCDGSAVSRTEYAALFDAIGTSWGPGNGFSTFNLPNLMSGGRFLRGGTPGLDSYQGYTTARPTVTDFQTGGTHDGRHAHYWRGSMYLDGSGYHAQSRDWRSTYSDLPVTVYDGTDLWDNDSRNGSHQHTITGGDSETRPINAAVRWIIKY